jgi:hypothetical protein
VTCYQAELDKLSRALFEKRRHTDRFASINATGLSFSHSPSLQAAI